MFSNTTWKLFINSLVVFMFQTPLQATGLSVVFQSKTELQKSVAPLTIEEVTQRIASPTAPFVLNFEYNERLTSDRTTPLRNPRVRNLLKTELYKNRTLTVFYPESPRVPHHLTIVVNRRDIRGISSISQEENEELFHTIKKIAEIYKSLSIHGYVIAQFDTPQMGHFNHYVVELIPHLPGFEGIKNIVDKMDCNRHVLFRSANLSPVRYTVQEEEKARHVLFWQAAFQKEQAPLNESDLKVVFPFTRKESHQNEANEVLYLHLTEILTDRGGYIDRAPSYNAVMPTTVPSEVKSVTVEKCFFCDEGVKRNQLVYDYEGVTVFYNVRKGAQPGSSFLLLPKRHTQKVYGLSPDEVKNIYVVRKALVEVLKEVHPECEVVIYTQDDPSVGQTVFHSHEQIVAIDPKTIDLTWTMMCLYPTGNVSNEEMLQVRKEFGQKLQEKIEGVAELKDAI